VKFVCQNRWKVVIVSHRNKSKYCTDGNSEEHLRMSFQYCKTILFFFFFLFLFLFLFATILKDVKMKNEKRKTVAPKWLRTRPCPKSSQLSERCLTVIQVIEFHHKRHFANLRSSLIQFLILLCKRRTSFPLLHRTNQPRLDFWRWTATTERFAFHWETSWQIETTFFFFTFDIITMSVCVCV